MVGTELTRIRQAMYNIVIRVMSGDRADVSRSRLISMISNIINTEQRAINRLGQQAYC